MQGEIWQDRAERCTLSLTQTNKPLPALAVLTLSVIHVAASSTPMHDALLGLPFANRDTVHATTSFAMVRCFITGWGNW